ncbi:MAG: hypothetical protein G01um101456_272 [Parcubacteria group bacterium Gr01-1014_56]|nr:MAG: hypothetical protein G01um101456_272 [Parcubacteria group bacterium Gr01-1014_56]
MGYSNGYTGHLFEVEVLGICRASYCGYMSWKDAAELVRKSQPVKKTPTVARLEQEVGRQLGEAVKFYTAVRSAMDVLHGTDGFFEFHGFVVTIDVTMNPHKDSGKADVIICEDDLGNLPNLAGRIAREFITKQRRAG